MTAGLRIRPMTAGDLDAVLAIAASLDQAPHWPRSVYAAALDAEAQPQRVALLAETQEREVVGFAVCSLVPPQAELESIAVASAFQRRGVAQSLVSELVDDLRVKRVAEILLEVRAGNGAAITLYRKCGFEAVGRRLGYYSQPGEDAVLLRLLMG